IVAEMWKTLDATQHPDLPTPLILDTGTSQPAFAARLATYREKVEAYGRITQQLSLHRKVRDQHLTKLRRHLAEYRTRIPYLLGKDHTLTQLLPRLTKRRKKAEEAE